MRGQATAEYAGLLAIAGLIGASLALVAGPPLAATVRDALAGILSRSDGRAAAVVPTAADLSDVEPALVADATTISPEAALVALAQRHGAAQAADVASAVILAAARRAAPSLGLPHTYRAWLHADESPYAPSATLTGDRDSERPTGPLQVAWITIADQRLSLSAAEAHHTSFTALALDAVGVIPGGGLLRDARAGSRAVRVPLRLSRAVDHAAGASAIVALSNIDDDDIPAGLRAGDVVVAWPARRTYWRDGRIDPAPHAELGIALPVDEYWHRVFLRPAAHGLAVIAEGIGR